MPPNGSPPSDDLYRLLEVSPTATTAEIEAAWRSAIRGAHPDIAADPGATAAAARLNLAREWLTDPDGRAAYDRSRGRTDRPGTALGHARRPGPWASADPSRVPDRRAIAPTGSSLGGVVGLLGVMAFFVALMGGITETGIGLVALVGSIVAMGAALILALRGPAPPGR